MPELPEVETVRRGLEPILVGSAFARVEQRRPDLRFPLPNRFGERLSGRRVEALDRRAKYLLARLDDGEVLVTHLRITERLPLLNTGWGVVIHLGIPGRFPMSPANGEPNAPGHFAHQIGDAPKHEHVVFHLGNGTAVRYTDTRRFGLMDLVPAEKLESPALSKGLGIEPLSKAFTADWLAQKLKGKATSIKAAL